MKRLSIVALLLLAAAMVAGIARPEGPRAAGTEPSTRTITVSGLGQATSTPTRAQVSFGVQTQAASAKAALAQNAAEMRRVLDALQKAGAQDLRTEVVSLSPTYTDNGEVHGYSAVNTVSATVTYAAAGTTIDAAVDAGANQVNGPTPLAGDVAALYRKALADAIADARDHAKALAAAAGESVGRVTAIIEGSAPGPIVYNKAAAVDASTPVVAGPQETMATVTVTFELT